MSILELKIKFPDFAEKLKKHRPEIERFLAAQMQFNRGMLFDKEGAYNGHKKWAPLVLREGQILSKRGNLRKSIAPRSASGRAGSDGIVRIGGGVVTIGSKLIYASLMNWGTTKLPGGVLKPKNAKALMIPLPKGKAATATAKGLKKSSTKIERDAGGKTKKQNVIFRKSVRIPERRFDNWTPQDEQEISQAMEAKIAQVLNK